MPTAVKPSNRATLSLTGEGIAAPAGSYRLGGFGEQRRIGPKAWREYADEMRIRYTASRLERGRLLGAFTAVTGHHRKNAIALLRRAPHPARERSPRSTRFSDEVVAALVAI